MSSIQLSADENEHFNTTFARYKGVTDRHQSLYIFVINGMVVEEFIERVKKMITIVDAGTNPSKKAYLKSKLNNFVENLLGIEPLATINGIYFVSNTVHYHDFRRFWKETLDSFGCDKVLIQYDDTYQLDWLNNLLLDRSYINILHIKSNTLKHVHLGLTKKRVFREKTEKNMDLTSYIQENVQKGETCLVHGVSSFLKGIQETETLKVFTIDKRDEELLNEYDKIINEKNSQLLRQWLDRMLDPKEGRKLVFGKDIGSGITDRMLKTIFCSPERKLKLIENYATDNTLPELIVVKTYGDDIGKRLVVEFKGAVGIKFY